MEKLTEVRVFFRSDLDEACWDRMLREAREGRPQFYASLGPRGRIGSYWIPKRRAVAAFDKVRGYSRALYPSQVPEPLASRAAAAGVSIEGECNLELGMVPNRWVRFQPARAHGDGGGVISFRVDRETGNLERKRPSAAAWERRSSVLGVSIELARTFARRQAAQHVESLGIDRGSPAAGDAFVDRLISTLQAQMREEQQGWDEPARAVEWLRSLVAVDRTVPLVLHLTHVEHADASVVEFVRLAWETAQREGLPLVLEIGDESADSEVGKRMVDEVRGVAADPTALHVYTYGSAADTRFPLSWTTPGLSTRHAQVGEALVRAFAPDSGEGCAFVCHWLELAETLERQGRRSDMGGCAPHRRTGALDSALERCRVGAGDRVLLIEAFARTVAEWIDRCYDPYGCEARLQSDGGLGRSMISLPPPTQILLLGWAREQFPLPAAPVYSEHPTAVALRALDLGLVCAGSQRAWSDAHSIVRDLRRVDWTEVPDALVSGQHRVMAASWARHVGDVECARRLMQGDAARWRQRLDLDPSNQPAEHADPRSPGAAYSRRASDHRQAASGFALAMFSTMVRARASMEDGIDPIEAGVIPAEQVDAWRDLAAGEQVVGSFAWCEEVIRSMDCEHDGEDQPPAFAADGTVRVDDEDASAEVDGSEQQDWSLQGGPLPSANTPRSHLACALDRIAIADDWLGESVRALHAVREAVELRTRLAVTEDADWERIDLERSLLQQAYLGWRVEREFGRPTEAAYATFTALAEKIGKSCFERMERGGNPFFLLEFVQVIERYADIASREGRLDDELEALVGASFGVRLTAAMAGPKHAHEAGMWIVRRLAVRRFQAGFRAEARALVSSAIEWSAAVERSRGSLHATLNRLEAELDFVGFERSVGLTEPAHARLARIAPEARSLLLPRGTDIALLAFGRVMERVAEANAADGDLGVALAHIDEIVRTLSPDASGLHARPRSCRLLLQRALRLGAQYADKLRREETARRYRAQADAVPTAMLEVQEVEIKTANSAVSAAARSAESEGKCRTEAGGE